MKANHPLACIIAKEVTESARNILTYMGVTLIETDLIRSPYDSYADKYDRPALRAGYTKIILWSLTQYKKLLYLDADMMLLNNIDAQFDNYEGHFGVDYW